jgi:hypothetical protein
MPDDPPRSRTARRAAERALIRVVHQYGSRPEFVVLGGCAVSIDEIPFAEEPFRATNLQAAPTQLADPPSHASSATRCRGERNGALAHGMSSLWRQHVRFYALEACARNGTSGSCPMPIWLRVLRHAGHSRVAPRAVDMGACAGARCIVGPGPERRFCIRRWCRKGPNHAAIGARRWARTRGAFSTAVDRRGPGPARVLPGLRS